MSVPIVFVGKDGLPHPLDELLKVDERSGALVRIPTVHYEIHKGHHFYLEGFATLADAGTLYAKLVTPDTAKRFHFRWMIDSSGILETNFYEGASGGMAGGAIATPLNSDRNSGNVCSLVITTGIAVATDKGTLVSSKKVGGTGFKTFFGGSAERDDELILKQGTTYFREFISGSADNIIAYRASWYEH